VIVSECAGLSNGKLKKILNCARSKQNATQQLFTLTDEVLSACHVRVPPSVYFLYSIFLLA
jgi:hypothetical protein